MNNLTSLFPANYKNLEQKEAIALLEKIYEAVEGTDKSCEYCNNCGDNYTKYREFYKNMFSDVDKYVGIARQIKSGKYVLHIELTEDDYDGDCDISYCPICGRKQLKFENSTLQAKVRELESEKQQREEDKALTVEELKLMEGKPVYIIHTDKDMNTTDGWHLINFYREYGDLLSTKNCVCDEYFKGSMCGKSFKAYRHELESEDK